MSNKQRNYKYGEFEVNVTKAPVFDNNAKSFTNNFVSTKVQNIDFDELTKEVIKNNPHSQIPFVVIFTNNW